MVTTPEWIRFIEGKLLSELRLKKCYVKAAASWANTVETFQSCYKRNPCESFRLRLDNAVEQHNRYLMLVEMSDMLICHLRRLVKDSQDDFRGVPSEGDQEDRGPEEGARGPAQADDRASPAGQDSSDGVTD